MSESNGPEKSAIAGPSPSIVIHVGEAVLDVEIADTPELRNRGLMFRESLCSHCGMLFVFEEEQEFSFWMKNTSLPLEIGFFDSEGYLFEIRKMKPFVIFPQTKSLKPGLYALEVNDGWFEENNLKPGAKLVLEK